MPRKQSIILGEEPAPVRVVNPLYQAPAKPTGTARLVPKRKRRVPALKNPLLQDNNDH